MAFINKKKELSWNIKFADFIWSAAWLPWILQFYWIRRFNIIKCDVLTETQVQKNLTYKSAIVLELWSDFGEIFKLL